MPGHDGPASQRPKVGRGEARWRCSPTSSRTAAPCTTTSSSPGSGEKTGHSDTPLWLPLAVINYLKETGDLAISSMNVVPFQDGGEADVLDHVIRACDYVLSQLTENHLPKFGPGDWNDTLDYVGRKGKGESVWVAHFLCYILRETAELLDYLAGQTHCPSAHISTRPPTRYRREYELVAAAVNERCWDGEWYIRGIRDDGDVIGSSKNTEGRIFMNAQSWAVISGCRGRRERASPGDGLGGRAVDNFKRAEDFIPKLYTARRGHRPCHAVRAGQERKRRDF